MKRLTVLALTIVLSIVVSGCGGNPTQSDTVTTTENNNEQMSTNDEKEGENSTTKSLKNGFNESTNRIETIGNCTIEIPDYFGENNDNSGALLYYAETGKSIVMLQCTAVDYGKSQDEFNEERDSIFMQIASGMTSANPTDMDIKNEYFKGKYPADDGTEVGIECRMNLTYVDGIVYVPVLVQSDESAYDYSEDFNKICASLHSTETGQDSTENNQGELRETTPITSGEASYDSHIAMFDVFESPLGDGYSYDAIVEIENTGNSNIIVNSYSFDFEDANNSLVATDDIFVFCCPWIINPGEKGYLYSFGGTALEGVTDVEGIQLVPQFLVESTSESHHEYPVTDDSLRGDSNTITITGRITNDTNEDSEFQYVYVLLYDHDGNILDISREDVSGFLAGRTVSFESSVSKEGLSVDQVGSYRIIAREGE